MSTTEKNHSTSRILVVDDNSDIRDLITFILSDAGYQAVSATDGESAWELLTSSAIDLALLDVMMPGKSGLDLLGDLRGSSDSHLSQLPVLLISAKSQGGDIERGIALGANSYLIKPFKAGALLAEISATLEKVGTQ
jgi:two-component system OmpR family response regulator